MDLNEEKLSEMQQVNVKEMQKINGGEERSNGGYFRCTNPNCPVHYRRMSFAPEVCQDCGSPMEYVRF